MSSCIASSFSQGDAFISSKPERTTTFTSSPPRRREVRQQSIAVLPPPSTMTRLPILVDVAERDAREPVDADMDVARRPPGGRESRGRGRAARRSRRKSHRNPASSSAFRLSIALAEMEFDAHIGDVAAFLVDHRLGQAEARDLACASCRRLLVAVEHHEVVAERREVARHRQRGRAGADQRDALAVLLRRDAGQPARGCRPCCRRRRASGGRSPPAPPRPGRAGRPARKGGRRCGRGSRERRSISS